MKNVKRKEGYNQVCVWSATIVGKDKIDEFEKFMLNEFKTSVQYLEEIMTGPDTDSNGNPVKDTGGRNDLFFAVKDDDIKKFTIARLSYGIRWVEDVLAPINYRSKIYPERVEEYKI